MGPFPSSRLRVFASSREPNAPTACRAQPPEDHPPAAGHKKGGRRRSDALLLCLRGSGLLQVDRAGLAALVLLEVVADPLILVQRGHARPLDGRDVDEGVVAAALGLDEAIALVRVEEFDC